MRNATTEHTLSGHTFRPGDPVVLSYPLFVGGLKRLPIAYEIV